LTDIDGAMTQCFAGQLLHGDDGGLAWAQQGSVPSIAGTERVIYLAQGQPSNIELELV